MAGDIETKGRLPPMTESAPKIDPATAPNHIRAPYFCTRESDMLFIDGEAIVIDKPAGLPVSQPRRGGASLEDHFEALGFGFHRLPVAVHRLDQDTSGCLLLARHPKAVKRFSQAFAEARVDKQYIGIFAGEIDQDSGTIDLPLAKTSSAEAGWRMIVDQDKGKHAVTHWQKLASRDGMTLIGFRPETGRTHQIRAHTIYGLGLPLLGDPVYGQAHDGGMMLHALSLRLHRDGKPDVIAKTPWPERFANLGFPDPEAQQSPDEPAVTPHAITDEAAL